MEKELKRRLDDCDLLINQVEKVEKYHICPCPLDPRTGKPKSYRLIPKEKVNVCQEAGCILFQMRDQNNLYRSYLTKGQWKGISGQAEKWTPMSPSDYDELSQHITKFCARQTRQLSEWIKKQNKGWCNII